MVDVIGGRHLLTSFAGCYGLLRNLIHVAMPFVYLLLAGSTRIALHVEPDS